MAGGNPWDLNQLRHRLAQRNWRPQTGVEAVQGDPLQVQPMLGRALRVPLDPSIPLQEQPVPPVNVPIIWNSQTINSTTETVISAQPNRVILVVLNQSPTLAISVNFDNTATIAGTSPNFTVQGILLQPGVSLYIDRWCPTNTVHVSAGNGGAAAPTTVMQGFSAQGNVPEISLAVALYELMALLQSQQGAAG